MLQQGKTQPDFLSKIPMEALCRLRTEAAGEHENTSPWSYLNATSEGQVILQEQNAKQPGFLKKLLETGIDTPLSAAAGEQEKIERPSCHSNQRFFGQNQKSSLNDSAPSSGMKGQP